MLQVLALKLLKKWHLCCFLLLFVYPFAELQARDTIVIVDIPYALLAALGEYEELRSLEKKQHDSLDAQVIPVLHIILQEYQRQYATLQALTEHFQDPTPLQQRLQKMARFLDLFKDELTYRKTLLEVQEALKKQRELMENQ